MNMPPPREEDQFLFILMNPNWNLSCEKIGPMDFTK
jgi:hypothetical protein